MTNFPSCWKLRHSTSVTWKASEDLLLLKKMEIVNKGKCQHVYLLMFCTSTPFATTHGTVVAREIHCYKVFPDTCQMCKTSSTAGCAGRI